MPPRVSPFPREVARGCSGPRRGPGRFPGLAEIRQGRLAIALAEQGIAQIVAGHGEIRLDPQRLRGTARSPLRSCPGPWRARARVLTASGKWGSNRSAAWQQATARSSSPSAVGLGQVGMKRRLAGFAGDRLADQLRLPSAGRPVAACTHAQQVQQAGVSGMAGQQVLIDPRRLRQQTSPVVLHGCVQVIGHTYPT